MWADPFVVKRDGGYYIFVEEMPYATMTGHLAVIEIDDEGNVLKSTKILDTG
jgi:hypothetical protein